MRRLDNPERIKRRKRFWQDSFQRAVMCAEGEALIVEFLENTQRVPAELKQKFHGLLADPADLKVIDDRLNLLENDLDVLRRCTIELNTRSNKIDAYIAMGSIKAELEALHERLSSIPAL